MSLISQETREKLRLFQYAGISFCIVTLIDGQEVIHERKHQPCYGELRKYKKTHGEECTKPDTHRPGDLHSPFPKGTPVGLCFPICLKSDDPFLSFLFSDRSPWVRGFGSEKNVELFKAKNGYTNVIIDDTHLDPTVLVNLLKVIQYDGSTSFNNFLKEGMDEYEALMFASINMTYVTTHYRSHDYVWAKNIDFNAFCEGKSHDLTGGTLFDRFDYERPKMAHVFKAEGESGIDFGQRMSNIAKDFVNVKKGPWGDETYTLKDGVTIKDVRKAGLEVLRAERKKAA